VRLLLDLQCVQSTSAVRGIGRYAMALSHALVETAAPGDRVEVLLNAGGDRRGLLRARAALETFLPARRIHAFDAPWPWEHEPSQARRRDAELARAAAVEALGPDAVLVGSLFEGDKENVMSVEAEGPATAAILYDLIPATDPGTYLLGPGADSYWRRWAEMQRVDLLLSISEYSAQQARDLLGADCPPTTPVWGGPYPSGQFAAFEQRSVVEPPNVPPRYLLAVGGDHPRKNLDRLVAAWAGVPAPARADVALVLACRLNVGTVRRLRRSASRQGLGPDELVLTGEVTEQTLDALYRGALAFLFPSTEEGLGMPPLEAMAAACPTVLARGSSLSELAEDADAFFDGTDVNDMARALRRLLQEPELRQRLEKVARRSAEKFTWERTAALAWDALRNLPKRERPAPAPQPATTTWDGLAAQPTAVALSGLPSPRAVGTDVATAEEELGIVGSLALGVLTDLLPAAVLIVPDDDLARTLVQGGIVGQPVLRRDTDLTEAARHDVYARLRALPAATFPGELVRALAHPPRWSLERPWPVWLVLEADPRPDGDLDRLARHKGVVLVHGRPTAVVLARSVDHVLVASELLDGIGDDLQKARCLGTRVTVLAAPRLPVPTWAGAVANVATALANDGAGERTTGWPFRD
jgi:glycosyltransferase involved in cell wall biosynthesis